MPFESKAQNAWAHTPAGTKALGGAAKVKEWEHSTDYSHLPERKTVKHKFHSTEIKHHKDGSHTVHHRHEDPAKDVEHAVADHDGMMDSMQNNLGGGAGEEAPEAAPGAAGGAPMPGGGM
jgi:hypothetical protein